MLLVDQENAWVGGWVLGGYMSRVRITCQACGKVIRANMPRIMYLGYLIHKTLRCVSKIDVRKKEVSQHNTRPEHKECTGEAGTNQS